MVKIGAQICAFREEARIKQSILNIYKNVDFIVIACSEKPWSGDLVKDNTYKIAKELLKKLNIPFYIQEYHWKEEHEQRNWCLDQLRAANMDWCFLASPDRFFTIESFNNIRAFAETAPKGIYGSHAIDYWKDFNTVIYPFPSHTVTLFSLVNEHDTPIYFEYANRLHDQPGEAHLIPGVTTHHITWVKTDEEVKSKIESYTHAKEILPNWYQDVWLNKSKDLTNFAPVTPHDYKKLVKYSLPSEIRKLWK